MEGDVTAEDVIASLRGELAEATTRKQALAVLSEAGTAVLRGLEPSYFLHAGPAATLRERIADAHVRLQEGWRQQSMSTGRVTSTMVSEWAMQALIAGLTGYTDFDPAAGGQYAIAFVSRDGPLAHIEVTTPQGFHPRRYCVAVTVTPVGPLPREAAA